MDYSTRTLLPAQMSAITPLCTRCGLGPEPDYMATVQQNWTEILNLTRSGSLPNSDFERLTLVQQLQDTQDDIDRCQRELDRLRELAEALETQKQVLSSHRDRIHSIVASPMRTLPIEILVEIFGLTITDDNSNIATILGPRDGHPILTLRQVCNRWYNLVNNTPALWSTFTVVFTRRGKTTTRILKFFLEKSSSHPLDFEFDFDWDHSFTPLISTPVVCGRWRRVNFSVVEPSLLQALLQPPPTFGNNDEAFAPPLTSFPQLVSLRLDCYRKDDFACPLPNCPRLQSLTLRGLHLYRHPSAPHWNSIRQLELAYLTALQVSHILESCPNARDVCLKWIRQDNLSQLPPLLCSQFRKLELTFDQQERVEAMGPLAMLLDSLTIPGLVHFTIAYEIRGDGILRNFSYLIDSICAMLYRSLTPSNRQALHGMVGSPSGPATEPCSSVTHFSLKHVPVSCRDIQHLFAALPSVTQFEYDQGEYDGGWERRIACRVIKSLISRLHIGSDDDEARNDENHFHDASEEEDAGSDCSAYADAENAGRGYPLPKLQNLTLSIEPLNEMVIRLIRSRWRLSPVHQPNGKGSQLEPKEELTVYAEPSILLRTVLVRVAQDWPGSSNYDQTQKLLQRCEQFRAEGVEIQVYFFPNNVWAK